MQDTFAELTVPEKLGEEASAMTGWGAAEEEERMGKGEEGKFGEVCREMAGAEEEKATSGGG